MGNHQSHQPQSSVDVVRRPPTRPDAPPSARPISQLGPNGPSYHSPENLVLPKEIPVMKLRPVSMELCKYNPEYQDIYGYKDNDDLDNEKENEENSEQVENLSKSPARPPPPIQNGHIPNMNHSDKERPVSQVSPVQNGILKSSEPKKVKINDNVAYRPTHRRQMSSAGSSNLTGHEHIIFEEPEENLDMRGKIDPLYQSYPGVSLPVKNNFNLDYSYQLTYAQLAESRRQKTLEELEKKTGKRISELSADLNDNVERHPFIRDEYSRVSTRSTGSTGSGLTNKKKKAPPPPSQPPPAPPSKSGVPIQKPKTPEYSPENEPIPDYDLGESPKRPFILPRYSVGPAPKHIPPPPPPQPNFGKPMKKEVSVKRTSSMQEGRPEIILKKTPSINTPKTPENPSGHIPWLLEMKHISESKAARRQISQETAEIEPPPGESKDSESECSTLKAEPPKNSSQTKLVFESSKGDFKAEVPDLAKNNTDREEIFALEELDKSIGEVNNNDSVVEDVVEEKPHERKGSLTNERPASPKLARHHSSTVYDRKGTPSYDRANSSPGDPVRRLNSLLQHDIKATAQAKCHKLNKQTTPVPPKPKDPHEVFRELLAKACTARDERVKVEGTIDDKLKTSASDANLGRVLDDNDKNTQRQASIESNDSSRKGSESRNSSSEPPEVRPKPRYHKNVTLNKNNNQPAWKQKSMSGGNKANNFEPPQKTASSSFDWTPEVDLDSDDNLSDREEISMRKGASEGFKSSIVPNTVTDLKSQKKQKGGKYKKQAPEPSEVEQSNKNKFGSVKKLKKSVHKGVRNAFGSISKASGKLLRKQRTEEMETVNDAPKNWKFEKTPEMKRSKSLDNYDRYRMSNGYAVSDSEYDGNSEAESIPNGHVDSDDESSDGIAEQIAQNIKRAGIAYVNDKGELVVLPDEKTVETDSKEMKHEKKKKRNKKQDKAAESLREKERKMEEERRKQLELELEMHKIREAETRERLQRLEAAQLQQQMAAQLLQQQQQQQQQQNYGMVSAPPLPPAGVFPPNYSNRTEGQTNTSFPNLYNQQLPQNPYLSNPTLYGQPSGSLINGSVPNMTYNLEDYMRMLGLQTPPTSQQMAFFLNNMTINGMNGLNGFPQQSDRKSNPVLYDILHPEPVKTSCGMQAIDPSANKYTMWSSSPNLNNEQSEPKDTVLNDFVASYQNSGAKEVDRKSSKSRNPLYSSDDSDSGLSPSRTMARAQVQDFRPIPVRTESGKFMKKYSSPLRDFEDSSKSMPDFDFSHNHVNEIPLRQRGGSGSVSPTNSLSTNDSTAVSSSDTPSSPGKSSGSQYSPAIATKIYGPTGFKTLVDFSKGSGNSGQVTVIAIENDTTLDLPLTFDRQDDPSKSCRM